MLWEMLGPYHCRYLVRPRPPLDITCFGCTSFPEPDLTFLSREALHACHIIPTFSRPIIGKIEGADLTNSNKSQTATKSKPINSRNNRLPFPILLEIPRTRRWMPSGCYWSRRTRAESSLLDQILPRTKAFLPAPVIIKTLKEGSLSYQERRASASQCEAEGREFIAVGRLIVRRRMPGEDRSGGRLGGAGLCLQ